MKVVQGKLWHRPPSITLAHLGPTDDDVREWSESIGS
jgi:hypothetical protein